MFPLAARIVVVGLIVLSGCTALCGEVSGPYANRVSPSDVAQIKAVLFKELHISHNVKKIVAIRPDKVTIQTSARTAIDEDTYYRFNVYKRAGAWSIDANSIQTTIEKRDFRTNGPAYSR